jgi:hypothetical protein
MLACSAARQELSFVCRRATRPRQAKRTVCMGSDYCVGSAYLVRIQPNTLYRHVLKAIQVQLRAELAPASCTSEVYNTYFQPFEVARRVTARRLRAVEANMPVDWMPGQSCTPSKTELQMTEAEAALLTSLEASLEQHELVVTEQGWYDIEYIS